MPCLGALLDIDSQGDTAYLTHTTLLFILDPLKANHPQDLQGGPQIKPLPLCLQFKPTCSLRIRYMQKLQQSDAAMLPMGKEVFASPWLLTQPTASATPGFTGGRSAHSQETLVLRELSKKKILAKIMESIL